MNGRKKRPNRIDVSSVPHTRPKRLRLSQNGLPPVYNDNKLARASINNDDDDDDDDYDDYKNYDDNDSDEYEYSSGDDNDEEEEEEDDVADDVDDADDVTDDVTDNVADNVADDDDDDSVPLPASIHKRAARNDIDTESVSITSLSSEELSKHQKRIATKLYKEKHTIGEVNIILIDEEDMKTDNPLVSGLTRLVEHDIIVDNNPIKPMSMRNSLANGRGLCIRLTRQSIDEEIRCIRSNQGIANNIYARLLTSDTMHDPDEPLLDETFVRLGNLKGVGKKGVDPWKMRDSAIPIIPRMNRFDASVIEYTMQYVLISNFPNTTYNTASVGTIDGILMFSHLYQPPKSCIPFAKVKDTTVYIHTIRRKLIVGNVHTRKSIHQTMWMEMFRKLVAYKKQHKSTNVPYRYAPDIQLANWVKHQRENYRNKKYLSTERINQLDSIKFAWDPLEVEWTRMYQKLVAYKKQHKSTNVPQLYAPDIQLANWVTRQRVRYKEKMLTAEQFNCLDSIKFAWDPLEVEWTRMYQKLVAYKKQHKSTNVPHRYAPDIQLANWVIRQRVRYKEKMLTAEQFNCLDSIGFVWNFSNRWHIMFQQLVAYKKENKSTCVPNYYQANQKLGTWVHHQRKEYSNKTLSLERINHLESIGFIWDPRDSKWMEMYHRLVLYKKKHGSTKLPSYYNDDPQLGNWTSQQRHYYTKNKLTVKRMELLNSIKFD